MLENGEVSEPLGDDEEVHESKETKKHYDLRHELKEEVKVATEIQ